MRDLFYRKVYDETSWEEDDVTRIVEVLARADFRVSRADALLAWREYSDNLCAGWLCLPEEDRDLLNIVMDYLEFV